MEFPLFLFKFEVKKLKRRLLSACINIFIQESKLLLQVGQLSVKVRKNTVLIIQMEKFDVKQEKSFYASIKKQLFVINQRSIVYNHDEIGLQFSLHLSNGYEEMDVCLPLLTLLYKIVIGAGIIWRQKNLVAISFLCFRFKMKIRNFHNNLNSLIIRLENEYR